MQAKTVVSAASCSTSRPGGWRNLVSALDQAAEILARPECACELETLLDRLAAVLQSLPPFTTTELAGEPVELYCDSLRRLQAALAATQDRLIRRRGELHAEREELARLKAWQAGRRQDF